MFLFPSIHFQCLYRPHSQSIYLSIHSPMFFFHPFIFSAYTDQTLNLPTYLSISLSCVKSMFVQNTFSFDFTLRASRTIKLHKTSSFRFWRAFEWCSRETPLEKVQPRKNLGNGFWFRRSVNLMRWCHVWWWHSWRESSSSFQAARLPVCCRSKVRRE